MIDYRVDECKMQGVKPLLIYFSFLCVMYMTSPSIISSTGIYSSIRFDQRYTRLTSLMMMNSLIGKILCIASIVLHSSALSNSQPRRVEWNTLKVRWGPDPLVTNGDSFVRQPRTVEQALQEQYKKLPTVNKNRCVGKIIDLVAYET